MYHPHSKGTHGATTPPDSAVELDDNCHIEEWPKSWSPGYREFRQYLAFVELLEDDLTKVNFFEGRRIYLQNFRQEMWPLGQEEWKWVYGMLLARNPHEIPERPEYDARRELVEQSNYYSGTDKKLGRNFRHPSEFAFNIHGRQWLLFRNWCWPTESTTNSECAFEVGPKGEQLQFEAQPPAGETWASLKAAQRAAVETPHVEERLTRGLKWNDFESSMREGRESIKNRLRSRGSYGERLGSESESESFALLGGFGERQVYPDVEDQQRRRWRWLFPSR